jgi:hypothetical protein
MLIIREKKSTIAIDDDSSKLFEISDRNVQDPNIQGTVVFQGNIFSTICQVGNKKIALVMSAYPSSFERNCTSNQITFHMTQERQSNMASRIMGVCGKQYKHHYFNDTNTNTCLVPFTSPLMNVLNYVTRQVQDSSGQILIGLIKKSYKTICNWKDIRSDDICPYGIITCPRHDKKGECWNHSVTVGTEIVLIVLIHHKDRLFLLMLNRQTTIQLYVITLLECIQLSVQRLNIQSFLSQRHVLGS